ncbi:MAG: hypothetical protein QXN26_03475 [Thermoplasmataceae archaeon]
MTNYVWAIRGKEGAEAFWKTGGEEEAVFQSLQQLIASVRDIETVYFPIDDSKKTTLRDKTQHIVRVFTNDGIVEIKARVNKSIAMFPALRFFSETR